VPPLVDSIFIDLGPVDDSLASRYPYQVGGFRWDYLFGKVLTLLHFMLSFTRARVPLGQIAVYKRAAQLGDALLVGLACQHPERNLPRHVCPGSTISAPISINHIWPQIMRSR